MSGRAGNRLGVAFLSAIALTGCSTGVVHLDSEPGSMASAPAAQFGAGTEQALAELQALKAPAGADAQSFAALKAALAEMLRSRHSSAAAILVAPDDLKVMASSEIDAHLIWTYKLPGDYDQNGEVTVADISPLGLYLGSREGSPNWYLARVADGDGNGEINLSDLSAIGQNFGGSMDGYLLEQKSSTEPNFKEFGQAALQADSVIGTGLSRRVFDVNLGRTPLGQQFRIRAFDGNEQGPYSDTVDYLTLPPSIDAIYPTAGRVGESLVLHAELSGSLPAVYTWSLEGGASPSGSTIMSPTVSLDSAGDWAGNLLVSGQTGEASRNFTLHIVSNLPPTASLAYHDGAAEGSIVLDAAQSSDPDGQIVKYEWDFNGDSNWDAQTGASPSIEHSYELGSHTAQVRVTDNDGETDIAAVNFSLVDQNKPPVAKLSASPASGAAPFLVHFDASASSDDHGIVKYEWDPYGLGNFSLIQSGASSLDLNFDAPMGAYEATVRVTDASGKTATASYTVSVTSVKYVPPPADSFVNYSAATDSNTTKWLKNCYAPLAPWRDPNVCYQTSYFAAWAASVLSLVNSARAANGLPAVQSEPHLQLIEQAHCRDMALNHYFAHVDTYALDYGGRLSAIDPPGYNTWGEVLNAGAGYTNGQQQPDIDGPQQVMNEWMSSPGHHQVIMNGNYTYAGVGIYYYPGDTFRCYWGIFFAGQPKHDPFTHDYLDPEEVQ